MIERNLLIAILILCSIGTLKRQTASDSLAIVSAQWEVWESPQKGLIYKYASIPRLYQGPQSVSLIEVDPGAGLKVDVAVSR